MPAFFLFWLVLFLFVSFVFVLVVIEILVVFVFLVFRFELHGVYARNGQRGSALITGEDIALVELFFFDVDRSVTFWTTDHNPFLFLESKQQGEIQDTGFHAEHSKWLPIRPNGSPRLRNCFTVQLPVAGSQLLRPQRDQRFIKVFERFDHIFQVLRREPHTERIGERAPVARQFQ